MATMTVVFTYDENDLGPKWFNEDNLKACLYGKTHTKPELLQVEVTEHLVVEAEPPPGAEAIEPGPGMVAPGATNVGLVIDTL